MAKVETNRPSYKTAEDCQTLCSVPEGSIVEVYKRGRSRGYSVELVKHIATAQPNNPQALVRVIGGTSVWRIAGRTAAKIIPYDLDRSHPTEPSISSDGSGAW